jgi:hypothetical protein
MNQFLDRRESIKSQIRPQAYPKMYRAVISACGSANAATREELLAGEPAGVV